MTLQGPVVDQQAELAHKGPGRFHLKRWGDGLCNRLPAIGHQVAGGSGLRPAIFRLPNSGQNPRQHGRVVRFVQPAPACLLLAASVISWVDPRHLKGC